MSDAIEQPEHYTRGGIETIDYLRAKLTPEEYRGYLRGNVIKYMSRAGAKAGESAAKEYGKARVYLEWLIEAEQNNPTQGDLK